MLLLGSVIAGGASAQTPATPERLVAVKAGRLIDVASGAVQENVTIVIRGDRIEAVGADVRVPQGAQEVLHGRPEWAAEETRGASRSGRVVAHRQGGGQGIVGGECIRPKGEGP